MNLSRFQFCLSHYCTATILLVIALASLVMPSSAQSSSPVNLVVSCEDRFPPPPIKVERKVGDTDVFVFTISATSGTLSNIHWDYPQNHTTEEWGTWTVSPDNTLTWNPPQEGGLKAAGVFNVGVSGNISCGGGSGSPLTFATSVNGEVLAKHWKPEPDITGGVMIAPQNQSATPTPAHVMTRVRNASSGGPVACEVTEATDLDTWEVLDETDTEEDDVIYTWSASGGTFDDPEHPGTRKDTVKGRTTQWYAPENIVGYFTLTCTIDDKPKEIKKPPESGRRDDPKIVRTVEVMVVSIHIDPQSLVLDNGTSATYTVNVYPPEAAQYIHFDQVSGSGNVTVTFDGSHLTITGQGDGNFTLNATSTETGQLLGAFGGKVVGNNDPPPGPDDFWPDLNFPSPSPGDPPPPPPVVWTPQSPISGGEIQSPQGGEKTVQPGESITLQVAAATDEDSKYLGHTLSGMVPESVSYIWKDQDENILTPDPTDPKKLNWTAPSEEGSYTITCTLVDANTAIPDGEYGSRDDDDVQRSFTIKVQEKEPDVDTGDDIRAAAGHIDNPVHKATIHLTTTDKDTGDPVAATLYLTFEGNKGSEDAKRAKFIVDGEEVEETTITTTADETGKFSGSVTVISSDVISQDVKVKVEWKDSQDNYKDVGSVTCDFGEAISKRNFALEPEQVSFPNDADNGWWFNTDILISGGDRTTAKLYLKFNKGGNEVPVNGHTMRISIGDIILNKGDGSVSAENYSRYIYFVDSDGNPLKDGEIAVPFVEIITSTTKQDDPKEQGYATVYLKGGPLIYQATTIKLKATDLTQMR